MIRPLTFLLAAGFALGLTGVLAAQDAGPRVPPGIAYEADVVFGKGGGTELALDIARPEKLDRPAPCIVFIHGGGWRGGNRKVHASHIIDFAKRGYVVATISYRLVPTARFPAQVEDVKCAIRYLRANAEKHQLDPQKIGAVGFSAGAHLAMLLGTTLRRLGDVLAQLLGELAIMREPRAIFLAVGGGLRVQPWRAHAPISSRPMSIRRISLVPAPMSSNLASRR